MKHLAIVTSLLAAAVCVALASTIFVSGRVFVPGPSIWARGYVGGVAAYAMAAAWLALGTAALFAGLMRAFPKRYFHLRQRRDIAFVVFAAALLFAIIGFIVERSGVRAF